SFASTTDRIHPLWSVRTVVHIPSSPFYVADEKLHEVALELLGQGQLFSCYMGHSSADALWSGDQAFLTRDDLAKLNVPNHGAGIFITCACWAAQYDPGARADHEGYALAAFRNPNGPVAVIAPTAESYSAAGYLALNGLLNDLSGDHLPERLGDAFLHVKA